MTSELFKSSGTDKTLEEGKSYTETLVGEGKKFKDVEDLAKGKFESDLFINQLQSENEQMRQELKTRMTLEEFWEKTNQNRRTDVHEDNPRKEQMEPPVNAPKPEEIAELVRRELDQEKTKSTKAQNLAYVQQELVKVYGPNFQGRLVARAQELGSSIEFLGSMAETQPKAFLQLMTGSAKAPASNDYAPPRTQMTTNTVTGDKRNSAYYSKMRKENPNEYWTPRVQNEMFKVAKELGEDFYKS